MQIKNDPENTSPILNLVDLELDVTKMTAKRLRKNGKLTEEMAVLMRSPNNDRRRTLNSLKINGEQFNIKEAIKDNFQNIGGEFGIRWCVLKNNKTNPSLTQIMLGVKMFFMQKLNSKLKNTPRERCSLVVKEYDKVFE